MKKIMGILNITPDSFYDGGRYLDLENAKKQIEKMIGEGVDIIDIGGFSSKPGSIMPSIEQELERILPVLKFLDNFDIEISVDTCRSEVLKEILNFKNIKYINDISGLSDENILPLVKQKNITYILMHILGTPKNMQNNIKYQNIIKEVSDFFEKKINIIQNFGINKIILDPGFGFGKEIIHNYEILKNLEVFKKFNLPILVGISRKSMIYKFLETVPENVLSETVALNLFAMTKGAYIIRVHDVKENKNIAKIFDFLEK